MTVNRACALLLATLCWSTASAQDYPAKPITIIVPFAAGGPSDVLARNLGSTMSAALKQQIKMSVAPCLLVSAGRPGLIPMATPFS